MALATKCPHCNTIFRVAADQLKLRGGIVRCGSCQQVFDGNAALVEPAAKPTPVIPDVAPAPTAAEPAISDYVHGAPVDFELDLADAPSPDEIALAAVSRAFASVTALPAAEAPTDEAAAPLDESAAPLGEPAAPLDEPVAPPDEAPAPQVEAASPLDETPEPAEEPPAEQADAAPEADVMADDSALADSAPAPADELSADSRIEPTLDTPQEHIVAAVLDDAHHFEDLPTDEAPSHSDETWPDSAAEPLPADAPWSLSEPEPEPEPESEPARDDTALHAVAAVNADVPDDGASLPDDEAPEAEPAGTRRARALQRAKARRDASGAAPASAAADGAQDDAGGEDLDHSDLSFVKRVERSQKYGKAARLTMALGIPLLLAGLALQAATTFRDTLAASYPQLKPLLSAVCQPLGCRIALPTQLDALSIEQGELASMADNIFSFSTVLRNQSKIPQAWPHIELTLNDNADKPVLRRVFAPRDYLPAPAEAEKGFGPRSEQSVKLYFELKQLKASGYHIAIFYP